MIPSTYNNYSQELLAYFPKLASGQRLVFRVSNTYFDKLLNKQVVPTSTVIRSIDRIFDPGHNAEIDIAYITGSRPLGPNALKAEEIMLGEISFTRGNLGMFEWTGEKATEALARFLFFSNSNGSNVGKPWYMGGTTQYILVGDENAKQQLGNEVLIDKAKAKLAALEPSMLSQLGIAWYPQDYDRLSEAQLMLRLRSVAEKDPQRILNMNESGELQVMASVNSFIKESLIRTNENDTQWLFKDGTVLVNIRSDEAPYLAIKRFFSTDVGQRVYVALEEELTAAG